MTRIYFFVIIPFYLKKGIIPKIEYLGYDFGYPKLHRTYSFIIVLVLYFYLDF